ncbi:Winged helix DNA-binding domain-containing protein [Mycena sanguinolenta]|uniref:Winged helix DNA-binding domain-containing protein n=1 Tax=Mycena sanguinolenta TaxID=230812 RepID=A0A8H7DJ78_9AGAR|nr:Winged helix DNA-binding domain-containing protein [Mycena sanguinolenta]
METTYRQTTAPPSRDDRQLPNSVNLSPLEELIPRHSTQLDSGAGRYEGGRVQGTKHSGRQQRIQEHKPYRRGHSQRLPTLTAPYIYEPYVDTEDFQDICDGDSGYQSSSSHGEFSALGDDPLLSSPCSSESALPPSAFVAIHGFRDAGNHLRTTIGIPPGAPINLWAVTDPPDGSRPGMPLPRLIQLAIYGSKRKILTLQEICSAIAARFQFFREEDRIGRESWRNSIRHALSLYSVFIKIKREEGTRGRGDYWVLNVDACVDSPYGRQRKRRSQRKGSEPKEKASQKRSSPPSKPTTRRAKKGLSALDFDEGNLDPALRSMALAPSYASDSDLTDSSVPPMTTKSRARSGASSRRRKRLSPLK